MDELSLQNNLPSWALGPFQRPEGANPVIHPDPSAVFECPMNQKPIHWEALHTFNPAAVIHNGAINVLYRAEDNTGDMSVGGHTSRLGLAISSDGLHFSKNPGPVFYPADDAQKDHEFWGGCEDPRIVQSESGDYVMTYTQFKRTRDQSFDDAPVAEYCLGVATSCDLLTWEKHGPAFAMAHGGRFIHRTKSGAIVSRLIDDNLVATKINGRYWMYYGVSSVHLAVSDNLVDWEPLVDSNGDVVKVMAPRPGRFDNNLTEVGPAALVQDDGIVLIYNGMNGPSGDKRFHQRAYCGGQALFAADEPTRLLERLDDPFIFPLHDYEQRGQYEGGTTFTEGLVAFDGKWFLYYGCADSLVSVAVALQREGGI